MSIAREQLMFVDAEVHVLCDWLEERGEHQIASDLRALGACAETAESLRKAYRLGKADATLLALVEAVASRELVARDLVDVYSDEMGVRKLLPWERREERYMWPPRFDDGKRVTSMRTPRGVYAYRFLCRKSEPRPLAEAVAMVQDGRMWRLPQGRNRYASDYCPFDSAEAWAAAEAWLRGILDDLGLLEVRP